MLNMIAGQIGGRVREDQGKWVLWVVDNKEQIQEIIKIFDEYPPITTKMELQVRFMKACLAGVTMGAYLSQREQKYAEQASMAEVRNGRKLEEPSYFNI